jgi:signal transduction histidine kinase
MNRWNGMSNRLGVRSRTTLIVVAVLGTVLAGSGALLVVATRAALFQAVETTVTARAVDLATQVSDGVTPRPVPLVRGMSVQVVVEGAAVSSTQDIEGQRPILDVAPLSDAVSTVQVPSLDASENGEEAGGEDGDEGPFLVAVAGAIHAGKPATVLVAASLAAVDSATRALVPLLALGVPAITLLAGLTIWRSTGRAFRPVEAMATQAEAISYSDLHLRVTEPAPDDEIRRLSVVLNRMLERLETSVARQRRFAADAGHELKSPVATLLTMAEVAEANPSTFTVGGLASDVAEQSRRLATLVDDLLVLARTDEHRLELGGEWFDLADVISEVVAAVGPQSVSIATGGVESSFVYADRRRIGQVVRNLLDNAVRHATSRVRVDAAVVRDRVTLRVADDGAGIPIADRDRVFERFVRLDEARSRGAGGTGLGLSVVQSIVEAHRGTIDVSDDPELGGASIAVVFPAGGVGSGSTPPAD